MQATLRQYLPSPYHDSDDNFNQPAVLREETESLMYLIFCLLPSIYLLILQVPAQGHHRHRNSLCTFFFFYCLSQQLASELQV